MEKKDYIESMIEQMGIFLRRLLSDLIKNIGPENRDETISLIEEKFSNEFNTSIDELIKLSEEDLKSFIIKHKFRAAHLEDLAELLYQMSLQNVKEENYQLLREKAIQLLDLADLVSNSYSIERINKKNKIIKTII